MKQFTAKIDGATSKGVNVHMMRHAVSGIAKSMTRSWCSRRLGQDAVIDIFWAFPQPRYVFFVRHGVKVPKHNDIENPEVEALFESYPKEIKSRLLSLRRLIFDVASRTDGVGKLEETLKWGQPSYLTTQTQSGSLVRIDQIKSQEGKYAMYFHCQTTLVDTFKEMYRDQFEFGGNRSIIFNVKDKVPVEELSHCVSMVLTYHLNKKQNNLSSESKHITTGSTRTRQKRRAG